MRDRGERNTIIRREGREEMRRGVEVRGVQE